MQVATCEGVVFLMSKVISKVRCYSPSLKNTPSGNVNHLHYIARRNMAISNEKGVSTFGDIESIDVESAHLKEIAEHIGKKSTNKTNVYRGIISLKEESALHLGYDKQAEWKDLMNRRVYDIANTLGIPTPNVEWVAVVHLKKGNPHLHYMVWDKRQEINDYFISIQKQTKIRELLTKDIFNEELLKYYNLQNDTKNTFRNKALALEIKAFDKSNCIGKLAYTNIPNKVITDLYKRFNEVKQRLPKSGRLTYAFMPDDVKLKINEFMQILKDSNIDLQNECAKYIQTSSSIGAMYGDGSKKYYEKKAIQELDKLLGNQFLNAVKMLNLEQFENKTLVNNLVQEMFRFLSILNESNEAKYNLYKNYKGEMSKQAKRDFAINKANSSNMNWEQ